MNDTMELAVGFSLFASTSSPATAGIICVKRSQLYTGTHVGPVLSLHSAVFSVMNCGRLAHGVPCCQVLAYRRGGRADGDGTARDGWPACRVSAYT